MNKRKFGLLLFAGVVLCIVTVSLLLPFGSSAADKNRQKKQSSRSKNKELPNYDAFLASQPRASKSAENQKTRNHFDQYETRLDVPTFLWAYKPQSSVNKRVEKRSGKEDIVNAAKSYIGIHAAEYRLAKSDLTNVEAVSVHNTGKGAIIVKFKQNIDGVEVFRNEMNVVMNRDLDLVAVTGYLTGAGKGENSAAGNFRLQPEDAVARAAKDLSGRELNTAFLTRAASAENENAAPRDRYTNFTAGDFAIENYSFSSASQLRAKKVFYQMPDRLVPAFYVELNVEEKTGNDSAENLYYSYVVSAIDGTILFRNNLTTHADFSYRVFADATPPYLPWNSPKGNSGTPHPTGTPDGYEPPFIASNLVTLQNSPYRWQDPWLPNGATETSGNNVDAYADLVAPDNYNTGDLRPTVTSPGVFDRTFRTDIQPNADAEQIAAATTQLFFTVNFLHDWFYDAGFDEASGNAQNDNFGRGGLGNDAIRAQAQDYGGTNNANMSTPADGASPRMQMYIFSGPQNAFLTINTPASIAGQKAVGVANSFGPQTFDVTGDVVAAIDESNTTGPSTTDACTALTNAADVAGKIALIDRGACAFNIKVQNAQNAGAIGVIIADNTAGPVAGMGGSSSTVTIPSLRVTQSDGASIRNALGSVNARLFRGSTLNRDGTLDNQIVAHEWGHYISNRLIGNAAGLVNNQGRAMGEGWGDFHALMMTVRPEDLFVPSNANWSGVYSVAAYATKGTSPDSSYYGIRRIPYSVDFNKNALTFQHITNGVALPTSAPILVSGNPNAQVHNSGEVWATMLWECYVSLLRAYPFQEAQERMKFYLVNGYKMTPVAPTFVEARNAILTAALANDPADFQRLGQAFARRGIGVGAVAPDRNSTDHAGTAESYSTSGHLEFTGASLNTNTGDNDPYLDNGETAVLNFTVRNTGFSALYNSTATISSDNPKVTFPNGTTVNLASSSPFGSDVSGSVTVAADNLYGFESATFTITFNDPGMTSAAPSQGTLAVRLNADDRANASATDTVESTETVWTQGKDTSLDPNNTGTWQRIRPAGGVTNRLWHGANAGTTSDIYLLSPDLIIDSNGNLTMSFDHSYDFESDATSNYDGGVIEMSINGGPWTDIGTSAYNGIITNYTGNLNPLAGRAAFVGSSGGTFRTTVTTTAFAPAIAPGSPVKVRFRIGTDNGVGAGGWQIDNITFSGISNTPFPVTTSQAQPTAANVSVSGRVLTRNNTGVFRAVVTITDAAGNARSAVTNPFGYYRFEGLEAGQSYVVSVTSKRAKFAPQVITPNESLTDVNFISLR